MRVGFSTLFAQRRRNEEALRLTQFSIDNAPEGAFWVGSDARFLYVNEAACRSLGYSRDELLSMTFHDIDPFFTTEVWRERWRLTKQQKTFTFESRHRRKDGKIIPVEVTATYLEFNGREYACAFARDITARKQAEERLSRSEKQLAEAQRVGHLGSWHRDMRTNTVTCSDGLYRIFGLQPQEFGTTYEAFLERVHPDDREYVKNIADTACLDHKPVHYDLRIVRPDGTIRMLHAEEEVIVDQSGTAIEIIGTGHDITERKRLEEELRQSHKMEAIGRLAGGVAHDFNNMLGIIMGYSDILLSELDKSAEHYRYVEEIRKATDRASSLTRQLLAFSRKQILTQQILDLNAVIGNTENMLRRLIGEDIDLIAVADPALGRVKADPGQMEQVLLNLAVNARDAMPYGGKLTIETANVDLDEDLTHSHGTLTHGHYVMVAVSDIGFGMDEETQCHIFEPFFTTKEQGKGTGLGLSTVFGIVKQSGGDILVQSRLGQGTTFKIYLPRMEVSSEIAQPHAALTPSFLGSETILLAEDEGGLRRLIRGVLESKGYKVLEASNGAEALRMSREHEGPIHLMVTDVVMPEMSGRELAQQMALLRPDTQVLYVSGYTDDTISRHGVWEASAAFLQKPFGPADLVRKVRDLLDADPSR